MIFFKWLFSSRHYELKIVLATLGVLIMLPVMSVVVFANAGLQLVSDSLAALNPITHLVEVFDPDGNLVDEIEITSVWPTRGYVSDEFGTYSEWRGHTHTGIDIANEYGLIGEPVTPIYEGRVLRVDHIDDDSCGINVLIQHTHHVKSIYCHLAKASNIEGLKVKPGDIIGLMGDTGRSSGPHLHLGIFVYDIPVNPRIFLVGEPEGSTVKSVFDVAF